MSTINGQPDLAAMLGGQFNEQMRDATTAAAEMFLDAYEQTLESIAAFHDSVASQSELPLIGAAAEAQAKFTRELAKRQVALARQLMS